MFQAYLVYVLPLTWNHTFLLRSFQWEVLFKDHSLGGVFITSELITTYGGQR